MVKFYGTSEPVSHTIERLLKKQNINYILIDEPSEVLKAQKEYNYSSLPFAVVDNEVYGVSAMMTILVGEED